MTDFVALKQKQRLQLMEFAANRVVGWYIYNCHKTSKHKYKSNKWNNKWKKKCRLPSPWEAIVSGEERSFCAIEAMSLAVTSSTAFKKNSTGFLFTMFKNADPFNQKYKVIDKQINDY